MFGRHFFLAFLCCLLTLPTQSNASPPPGREWFSITSEHFHVHFTYDQESFARDFTRELERSLPKLTRDLHWQAPAAIDIVINDSYDTANGMAISYPNTHIEVYSVPFDSDSVLMDYQNWIQELATHELTHIIANDTAFGAYQTLRSIFGSWVKPNGLQATWLVEGLAVFEETKQTNGGRGRSVFTEAFLRAAAQNSELTGKDGYSLDRFNDGYSWWWPEGNTAYLLGYAANASLDAHQSSADQLSKAGFLSERNTHRLPWQPNSALEDIAGKDWFDTWKKTGADLTARFAGIIPDEKNPAFCRLTHSGRLTGGSAASENPSHIYFTMEDAERGFFLARIPTSGDCKKREAELLVEKDYSGPTQVSVSRDEKFVLFTRADHFKNNFFYNDIYLYDIQQKSTRRLTRGERIRDPALLPNDSQFVAIHQLPANIQAIELRDLNGKIVRELYRGKSFERFANPSVHGNIAYFSVQNNHGQEEIFALDLSSSNKMNPAIQGFKKGVSFTEKDPFPAADGSLYYVGNYPSRSNTNSFDIYHFDPSSKKLDRVAQSSTGLLLHPIIAGNNLIASNYTSSGLDLFQVDLKSEKRIAGLPEEKEDLHEFLTGNKAFIDKEGSLNAPLSPTVPYDSAKTPATSLWPQYWMPSILATYDGALLGASTSGNDPLDYHQYNLTACYDTRTGFPTYNGSYVNRQSNAIMVVAADQSNNYFPSSKTSNRISLYSAEAVFPWTSDFSFSVGTAYEEKNLFASSSESIFLFDHISYDNVHATPSSIAPNRGSNAHLYLSIYPAARSENAFVDVRPSASVFAHGFAPSHSISLTGNFAVTTNHFLATNYYMGGGASYLGTSAYIVRGYPQDAMLGQKIATANLAYTLPIARPFSGWGTNPIFLKTLGLRMMLDAGTSSYLSRYDNSGTFFFYQGNSFAKEIIVGTGLDLLAETKLFYYIPVEFSLGLHHGLETRFGGETVLYFGVNLGGFGQLGSKSVQQ